MASLTLHRDVYVADLGRTLMKGVHPVGDAPGQVSAEVAELIARQPTFGTLEEKKAKAPKAEVPKPLVPTLESENAALAAYLKPMSQDERDMFWSDFTDDDLNLFLEDRFDVEIKDRPRGTMENMIESRLNL